MPQKALLQRAFRIFQTTGFDTAVCKQQCHAAKNFMEYPVPVLFGAWQRTTMSKLQNRKKRGSRLIGILFHSF
jgi:hypothetical protein